MLEYYKIKRLLRLRKIFIEHERYHSLELNRKWKHFTTIKTDATNWSNIVAIPNDIFPFSFY